LSKFGIVVLLVVLL